MLHLPLVKQKHVKRSYVLRRSIKKTKRFYSKRLEGVLQHPGPRSRVTDTWQTGSTGLLSPHPTREQYQTKWMNSILALRVLTVTSREKLWSQRTQKTNWLVLVGLHPEEKAPLKLAGPDNILKQANLLAASGRGARRRLQPVSNSVLCAHHHPSSPHKTYENLIELGLAPSICNCVLDFLRNRPQNTPVKSVIKRVFAWPQAPKDVLSFLLYSVYLQLCGFQRDSDYRWGGDIIQTTGGRVCVKWKKVFLNTNKNKEMIIDTRRRREERYVPLDIKGTQVKTETLTV